MSHFACHKSFVKCLCWSLGHAEQLLFSCARSKVSICNYVICHLWHFASEISYVKCLCRSLGHAEQFLFSCIWSNLAVYWWKWQWFFWTTGPLPVSGPVIEIPGYLFFQKCPKNNLKAGNPKKWFFYHPFLHTYKQFKILWPGGLSRV